MRAKKKDSVDTYQGIEIEIVRTDKRVNLGAIKENCINYEKFELYPVCQCFCTENKNFYCIKLDKD